MADLARAAAMAVTAHADGPEDARMLLDILGLVDEHGHLVEHLDETSGHGWEGHDVVLHERTVTSTAPAALLAPAAPPLTARPAQVDQAVVEPVTAPESEPTTEAPQASPEGVAWAYVDGEWIDPDQAGAATPPALVTVDVGEVVVTRPAVTSRDLLGEGLQHRDPVVRAAAQKADRAIKQLVTVLATRGGR